MKKVNKNERIHEINTEKNQSDNALKKTPKELTSCTKDEMESSSDVEFWTDDDKYKEDRIIGL